jgi:NAD(P)-dependent dehydrogenase (short-subunit alcohol dehydrogenase family)
MNLTGTVAVVTGGTKGIGGGVARELANLGARVFATGRSATGTQRVHERITMIACDHREDVQVDEAFAQIARETNAIDILVNGVWGGYERMVVDGEFTWPKRPSLLRVVVSSSLTHGERRSRRAPESIERAGRRRRISAGPPQDYL